MTVLQSLNPPISDSYWVVPGQLLAGEYPGAKDAAAARAASGDRGGPDEAPGCVAQQWLGAPHRRKRDLGTSLEGSP
jgi:hypothetical protein